MDTSLYLDVNRLTRETPWAHTALAQYALWGGLALLATLLAGGWLWARRHPEAVDLFAVTFLTGLGTLAAVVVNQKLLSPVFARPRPFVHHPGAVVLLSRSHDFSFPSDHCVIAASWWPSPGSAAERRAERRS